MSKPTRLWSDGHTYAAAWICRTKEGYTFRGGAIEYHGLRVSDKHLGYVVDRAWLWLKDFGVLSDPLTKDNLIQVVLNAEG